MHDRMLTITWTDEQSRPETYTLPFDSNDTKDSEALHLALCEINPSDHYLCSFYTLIKG